MMANSPRRIVGRLLGSQFYDYVRPTTKEKMSFLVCA